MNNDLRFNIADKRLCYKGKEKVNVFDEDPIIEFNHRHRVVLGAYDLQMIGCEIITLSDQINHKSNLGALRNRQLRQSVILSAALSAFIVGVSGRGSFARVPKEKATKELANELKRTNDRDAAQVMAEVLQITTETFPKGEEVLIESAITEGVRVKPGVEPGGNPTVAVGAVFGKKEHRDQYGISMPENVTLLSMGNDVVEGTTKSVLGLHSSMTTLFVTEANVKRHLPDVYLQRWMSGAHFEKFNPRDTSLEDAARHIAEANCLKDLSEVSAFFLDRPRHHVAMDTLNKAGVATAFDQDGDLIPSVILGLQGLQFPERPGLNAMIGEIGGSAEWAVGVLPLVWRGGQAIGMLTSQSSLTRKDLSPEDLWKERFHFTEEEFIMIQDSRFERKPYFTIHDIIEDPFAGGVSAFGAITDNYYLPNLEGVQADKEQSVVRVNVLVTNSMGIVECWRFQFKCRTSLERTIELMKSPKERLDQLPEAELEREIGKMLDNEPERRRYQIFFNNEYYPALIPVHDKVLLLHRAVKGLIERGALTQTDGKIVEITERLAADWFV